uniref:Reverse transcriptase domain-containing protein n=1 Tax=Strigamia maritima TaxID=126957 RepID=T1IQ27_STRMM
MGWQVMITGDFNARIANNQVDLEDMHDVKNSEDDTINEEGRLLLKFCGHHGIKILNDTTDGDWNGKLTSINIRGASVVDYFITNDESLVSRLKVQEKKREGRANVVTVKDCKTGNQFWTEVNRYRARKKAKSNDIGHEQWNEHFCALLAGSEEIVDTPVDQGLLTLISKGDDRLDQCFTLEEFKKTLLKLKRGKAPGKDGILNEFWRSLSLRSMLLLLDVINRIWLAETWPDSWRDGLITPIYKTGDASLANNYRGITLLNTLCKIVTSMMAKRISNWLFLEDKLSENQAGFRRKY